MKDFEAKRHIFSFHYGAKDTTSGLTTNSYDKDLLINAIGDFLKKEPQ